MNGSREVIDDIIGGLEFIFGEQSKRKDNRVTHKILVDAASTALGEPFCSEDFNGFVLFAAEVGVVGVEFGFSRSINPAVLSGRISNRILIDAVRFGLVEDIGRNSFVRCS